MEGVPYPVWAQPNVGSGMMMQPGQDYDFPGADYVDEYPQMQDGGIKDTIIYPPGDSEYMNLPSYNYDIIEMLNQKARREYEQYLKDQRDPTNINRTSPAFRQKFYMKQGSVLAQDGGVTTQEEINNANAAMMKARLAYANMHGNPAAQRMIVASDQPYQFEDGNTGTHYMASMDNYAVPQIQNVDGQLMLGDYSPESAEAMKFDNPEDAQYFAENYKTVSNCLYCYGKNKVL
jgi:hypothetical protein